MEPVSDGGFLVFVASAYAIDRVIVLRGQASLLQGTAFRLWGEPAREGVGTLAAYLLG